MNLCTLSNLSISSITLVAIFEVPAFPGIQKISFTEEDLDIVDANACSLPPLPIIAIFILIFIYLINEK